MKHNYDTDQLKAAHRVAAKQISIEEMHTTKYLSAFLDALPEPTQDAWIQCRFEEVKPTDHAVRFEFKDGSILQGDPERINRTDLYLWVGYMLRHVTLSEVKKGKATIYRSPAKVVMADDD